MSTTDNMTRKELPKKLEDDLNNVKYYKYTTENNKDNNNEKTSQKLTKFFDDSIEKTMYDEVFGPLLNRGLYINMLWIWCTVLYKDLFYSCINYHIKPLGILYHTLLLLHVSF